MEAQKKVKTVGELRAKANSGAELTKEEIAYLQRIHGNTYFTDEVTIPEHELWTEEEEDAYTLKSINKWGETLVPKEPIKHPFYIKNK